ncbi:hypothetical protein YC2023_118560 [Brassica napus]
MLTGTTYNAVRINRKLKIHKPDLQQIPYNLTGEEGEEEQEKNVSLFLVMVRSTAHQKAGVYSFESVQGKSYIIHYSFFLSLLLPTGKIKEPSS